MGCSVQPSLPSEYREQRDQSPGQQVSPRGPSQVKLTLGTSAGGINVSVFRRAAPGGESCALGGSGVMSSRLVPSAGFPPPAFTGSSGVLLPLTSEE